MGEAEQAEGELRLIDEAPRDGRWVVAYGPGCFATWYDGSRGGEAGWIDRHGRHLQEPPTRWRPVTDPWKHSLPDRALFAAFT